MSWHKKKITMFGVVEIAEIENGGDVMPMADKELWVLMRVFDELDELDDKAAQIRVVNYLVARLGLGWMVTNKAKPDAADTETKAESEIA